jgi:maltodextrin utilization protein YvdJ
MHVYALPHGGFCKIYQSGRDHRSITFKPDKISVTGENTFGFQISYYNNNQSLNQYSYLAVNDRRRRGPVWK